MHKYNTMPQHAHSQQDKYLSVAAVHPTIVTYSVPDSQTSYKKRKAC
jgi:hypothetical protein